MSEHILTKEMYENALKKLKIFCVIAASVIFMVLFSYVGDVLGSAFMAIYLAVLIYVVVWRLMKRKYEEDQMLNDERFNIWKKPLWEEYK
ncbi:MAG: hypothetical protein ACTSR2_07430 [Candidatus Hodarchaeales archaeon]